MVYFGLFTWLFSNSIGASGCAWERCRGGRTLRSPHRPFLCTHTQKCFPHLLRSVVEGNLEMGARPGTPAQRARHVGERQISRGLTAASLASAARFSCRQGRVDHAALIEPFRPSQRTECRRGQPGLSLQPSWPLLRCGGPAQTPSPPFPEEPTPSQPRCPAAEGRNYFSPASSTKWFFRGTVKTPELLHLPQQVGFHLQTPARPRTARSRPGSKAQHPKKPVRSLGATSPAAYCLLIPWEKTTFKSPAKQPELTPVTWGEDLDYHTPAAQAAQASWPGANAVDFAYWSIFFPLQDDFHMRRQFRN